MNTKNMTPKQLRETADRICYNLRKIARQQTKAVADGNRKDVAYCTEQMANYNADLAVVLEALDEFDRERW